MRFLNWIMDVLFCTDVAPDGINKRMKALQPLPLIKPPKRLENKPCGIWRHFNENNA